MFTLNRSLTVLKSAKTCFFLLGFAIAAWAPLVPYIKSRLLISEFELSLMILTMGLGSIIGMLSAAIAVKVKGTRTSVSAAGLLLCFSLAAVALIPGFMPQFLLVFIYGFAMGAMEVAVNLYAAQLEKKFAVPLMSGFHGFYSIGQIGAVIVISLFLAGDFGPFVAVIIPDALLLIALLSVIKMIDNEKVVSKEPFLVMPRGFVVILALIALSALTVEGAAIDWTGLLLIDKNAASVELAASGYLTVVFFMAVGRFLGARLLRLVGDFTLLGASVLLTGLSLVVFALSAKGIIVYAALALLGFSLANILPVAMSFAGKQKVMAQAAAVAAVSTCGYAAITFGPAVIGSIGTLLSLSGAFALLGTVLLLLSVFIFLKKQSFS